MKQRLIGGAGMVAILSLFSAIVLVPILTQSAEPVREIVLEARDLAFETDNPTLTFAPGERIRLVVVNTDEGVLHSIRLPGIVDEVRHIPWGQRTVIEFTAPESGGFEYTCPQHEPKMRGNIVIGQRG